MRLPRSKKEFARSENLEFSGQPKIPEILAIGCLGITNILNFNIYPKTVTLLIRLKPAWGLGFSPVDAGYCTVHTPHKPCLLPAIVSLIHSCPTGACNPPILLRAIVQDWDIRVLTRSRCVLVSSACVKHSYNHWGAVLIMGD